MALKKVMKVLPAPPTNWVGDGFKVHNYFPNGNRIAKEMSPFYLLDYNAKTYFPPSEMARGVGVHPHRGFETVTIAFEGSIAHHDSAGNSGVINAGGVQWMTAGSGVLHKEYHSEEFTDEGGDFQMIQLWVNLPAEYKMTAPKYQDLPKEAMGTLALLNDAGKVTVVAGEIDGVKGPANTFTPVELYIADLNSGGEWSFSLPSHFNAGILVLDGAAQINEKKANVNEFVLLSNAETGIDIRTESGAKLVVFAGEPINEPVAQYGPFLMNNHKEIQQAIQDFQDGKFGHLS